MRRGGRGEVGDAVGVTAEEGVLGLLCVHQRAHDLDDDAVEELTLLIEFLGLGGDLFADEPLDLALLDREVALVQHALDRRGEIAELDGLHQIVHRAVRERLRRGRSVVDGGEHHDREVGVDRERGGHEGEAGHAGHAHVGEHEDVPFALECVERRWPGVAGGDVVALGAQELGDRRADELLVVDEEDAAQRGLGDGPTGARDAIRLRDAAFVHRRWSFQRQSQGIRPKICAHRESATCVTEARAVREVGACRAGGCANQPSSRHQARLRTLEIPATHPILAL